MKEKRFKFRRQKWVKLARIRRKADSWRKPYGHNSKLRQKRKGYGRMPCSGYGNKKELKYLHPCGLKEILVHTPSELEKYDPKECCVRIAGSVGRRKRILIIEKAKELGFKVLNPGV